MDYSATRAQNWGSYIKLDVITRTFRKLSMIFEDLNPDNDNEVKGAVEFLLQQYGLTMKDYASCECSQAYSSEENYLNKVHASSFADGFGLAGFGVSGY